MLRAGLEFFAFTPRKDESTQLVFLRFDTMLDRANSLAELGISYPFRAWMLLSLLRLAPKKWSEYLKEMGHRFPRSEDEYNLMKDSIVRERTLEAQVGSLGREQTSNGAHGSTYFGSESTEEMVPLYLCLGNPAYRMVDTPPPTQTYLRLEDRSSQSQVTLFGLSGIDDSDSEGDTCTEEWEAENREDPYDAARLEQEQHAGKDPTYVAQ